MSRRGYYSQSGRNWEPLALVGLFGSMVAVIVALVVGSVIYTYNAAHLDEHVATCTVTNMDRGTDSDGNSNYRIYTRECGVLADEDSLWRQKFDSADVWAQLHPGQAYRLRIVGFRWPLMSQFPNVLDVEGSA